jgi:hypothetical protein
MTSSSLSTSVSSPALLRRDADKLRLFANSSVNGQVDAPLTVGLAVRGSPLPLEAPRPLSRAGDSELVHELLLLSALDSSAAACSV